MFKRIFLFFALNMVIVLTISVLLSVFHVGPYLTAYGLDVKTLAAFCLIWGMGGALISLLLSRKIAKWVFSIQIIDDHDYANPRLSHLYQTVVRLSQKIGLPEIPEVGVFHSDEANAFATGPSKRSSLVAVSTGLLQHLSDDEIEAVIGHELSHISSGDMVTMTLIQGVVNAFVMFLARLLAYVVSGLGNRDKSSRNSSPASFYLLTFLFEIVFMIGGSLIVAAFSRRREFRADKGAATVVSAESMIKALRRLESLHTHQSREKEDSRMRNAEALMIARPSKHLMLFATHPLIEKRIERLMTDFKVGNGYAQHPSF